MWYMPPAGRENLQQLPRSVQILHFAPLELQGPAMRRLVRRPTGSPVRGYGPALAVLEREGAKRCFGQFV